MHAVKLTPNTITMQKYSHCQLKPYCGASHVIIYNVVYILSDRSVVCSGDRILRQVDSSSWHKYVDRGNFMNC
jgi:hypothetical protein